MAATSSAAQEQYTWIDATSPGFLKLSAEIRNKIYGLTLVIGRVHIQELHPEEWQADQEAGYATRTSYKTRDHSEMTCSYWGKDVQPCTLNIERLNWAKISYTLERSIYHPTPPTIGMLALNRQTRAEAVPIFYGANEFSFDSMSAILPFLRDRSELSLQSMQFLHLSIHVGEGKHQRSRQESWARVFAELPKVEFLTLQKFTVRIYDPECRYAWKLKLDTKMQRWVHEMARNIRDLDMLGVSFSFSQCGEMTPDENVKEISRSQDLLWEFLAPKMLKKVGDETHDARSLLKRRIRNPFDWSEWSEDEGGEGVDGEEQAWLA